MDNGSRAKQPDLCEPQGLMWTLLVLARLVENGLKAAVTLQAPRVLCLRGLHPRSFAGMGNLLFLKMLHARAE